MKNIYFAYLALMLAAITFGSCSKDDPIAPQIVKVELNHLPTKVDYYISDEFDATGLTLKAIYSDNSSKIIEVKNEQVTGFNSTVPNEAQVLTVKEAGFVVTFTVRILAKDDPIAPEIVKVELNHLPTKVDYYISDEFDATGLTLKAIYSDNSSEIIEVKNEQVTGFNSAVPNEALELTVNEAGFVVTFTVRILTNDVQSISIKSPPLKTTYTLEEPLALEGMALQLTYMNGTTKEINPVASEWVKGFDSTKPSLKQTLQIGIDGYEVPFNVAVLPFKVVNNEIVSSVASDFKSFSIPEGITAIKIDAFFNNQTVVEVIFPASINSIGEYAFNNCTNLTKVDLSKTSISELSVGVFDRTGLVTILLPSTLKKIGGDALSSTKNLKELTLPEGLEHIGTTAFSRSGLETINIPNTVCYIERAFYECAQLKTVRTYGDKVTTNFDKEAIIASECFNLSPNIEVLEIPKSITRIGGNALTVCTVTTLILPASVKILDARAFGNAPSLKEITFASTTIIEASHQSIPSTIQTIKVPQQLVDQYKQDAYWRDFANQIVAI